MSFNDRSVLGPDGTRIAYSVEGQGPALVLTNGLTTTSTYWKYLRPLWLRRHTVVTWDLPGHGRSAPAHSARAATIEGQPEILARVMDAAQVERATHVGFSVGSQVVLELARHHEARCDAIVALLGPAGRMLDTTTLPLSGPVLSRIFAHTPELELVGQALHRLAPGSELVRIAEGTHTAMLEDPDAVAHAIDQFIARKLTRAA